MDYISYVNKLLGSYIWLVYQIALSASICNLHNQSKDFKVIESNLEREERVFIQ